MSMHDSLLSALQSVATVQLVASLRDARLNFDGDNDLRVFIPDLHLVSHKLRERYPYGTNDTGLLTQALKAIRQLAQKAKPEQKKVAVYQMGDFLDLWRETPVETDRIDAASRIVDDHRALMRALDAPGFRTRFLLGNHDFELFRWPNFVRSEHHYLLGPTGATSSSGMALHGDVFDELEMALPNEFQQLVVFYFSTGSKPKAHEFNKVIALVHRENQRHDFRLMVGGDAHVGPLASPAQSVPERHNVGEHKFRCA